MEADAEMPRPPTHATPGMLWRDTNTGRLMRRNEENTEWRLVVPEPTEICMECDGVGWIEGGETIKTTCKACGGSGEVGRCTEFSGPPPVTAKCFHGVRVDQPCLECVAAGEAACPTCQESKAGLYSNKAHTCGKTPDAAGHTLELRRVAQVVVWDATGACPLRCRDCLKVHGPGPVVMVFDQQGGQVHEFTGNWIELRQTILSAVFQHKGQQSVELHLGVPYHEDATTVELPEPIRRGLAMPQRRIDEVGL